jgi:hypothetical protein
MKLTTFLFLISITLSCYSQIPSPRNEKKRAEYRVKELIMKDSIFLKSLDAFLFQDKCNSVSENNGGFFTMKISERSCVNNYYVIEIEFIKTPSIHKNALGYFIYKKYPFIIYGLIPLSLFSRTGNSKVFIIKRVSIPDIEDFPYWKLKYEMNDLVLINFDCW